MIWTKCYSKWFSKVFRTLTLYYLNGPNHSSGLYHKDFVYGLGYKATVACRDKRVWPIFLKVDFFFVSFDQNWSLMTISQLGSGTVFFKLWGQKPFKVGSHYIENKLVKYTVQLNLHETDILFWYLSHHLTWHCSSIYEDLHRYDHKIVFVIVSEQF